MRRHIRREVRHGRKLGIEDSFLAKKGWQKSEAEVSGAYQYFKDDLHLASGGMTLKLGQRDTVAPEIILWDNE